MMVTVALEWLHSEFYCFIPINYHSTTPPLWFVYRKGDRQQAH